VQAVNVITENSAAGIWNRVVDPDSGDLDREAAKSFLKLRLAESDRVRMDELADKARDGTLPPTEETELSNYRHVGRVLELIKPKARQSLKSFGAPL
jgi:hypothetical protein